MFGAPDAARKPRRYFFIGNCAVIPLSPTRTLPGSAIFSSGRRSGGNLPVIPLSPTRTVPGSAIFGAGRRRGGELTEKFFVDPHCLTPPPPRPEFPHGGG